MSKTLLLADDSVVIQKLVGLSFANEDVEIIATDNGDDAVVRAREVKPDVILADVVMPGKSGYEVCEAIKQDPNLAHIPVLLLTGTFEAFDEARASAASADGQITKPFEAQALVERVNEVMAAPAAAPTPTQQPQPPEPDFQSAPQSAPEASSADFDFFDSSVSTLSAEDSGPQAVVPPSATDQTPAIPSLDVSDDSLFGAPGDGASDAFDTQGGGMALGESVAAEAADVSDFSNLDPSAAGHRTAAPLGHPELRSDATVVALPEPVAPLPPSQGDPLAAFERDLGMSEAPIMPSEPTTPPDLDSAFDSVPRDPEATIVAGIDDNNASTSPNYNNADISITEEPGETAGGYSGSMAGSEAPNPPAASQFPADDAFEDLTIHAPSAAIDHAVASAPSPTAIETTPQTNAVDGGATVVANLDIGLADSSPSLESDAPNPLDLGPSNVSADELDFAFDVSEQAPASGPSDGPGVSFSSLMDISESQILVGPNSDSEELAPASPPIDDSFAAGYDVSVSDLVTPTPPTPPMSAMPSTPPTQPPTQPSTTPSAAPLTPPLVETPADPVPDSPPSATPLPPSAPTIAPATAPPSTPVIEPPPAVTAEVSDPRPAASDPVAIGHMAGISVNTDLEVGTPTTMSGADERIPDLSPMIEQQIQETLEKVAWEAFSDLSETIVKQVIDRVEKIAWEVIPQMAETLVREEIRKMKGEND